jgi:hypothetical protein
MWKLLLATYTTCGLGTSAAMYQYFYEEYREFLSQETRMRMAVYAGLCWPGTFWRLTRPRVGN